MTLNYSNSLIKKIIKTKQIINLKTKIRANEYLNN